MASISAASFRDPRIVQQLTFVTTVEFISRHGRAYRITLMMPSLDLLGAKVFYESETGEVDGVKLPRKMAHALYQAARREQYLP